MLSLHVYEADPVERKNKPLLPSSWTEVLPQPEGTNGFAYSVYQNTDTKEIVISFRGTDNDFGDWTTNLGLSLSQEKQAAAVYARVLKEFGNDANITFTGHSLGGGLAGTMAVWFDRTAVVFDPAPSQIAATYGPSVSYIISTLGADAPQSIKDYYASISAQFATRESKVSSYFAPGSIVYSGSTAGNTITGAGQDHPVQFGIANMGSIGGRIDMHSQALLTAGLLSDTFRGSTVAVQRVLPLVMDKQFYAYSPSGSERNFLIDMIRSEQGTGDKLTHFGADLNKLGTNLAGLNQAAQDALIAQGIEWYYWQGTDYAGQEFFTQTGESLQYTTAMGAGLAGAQNKAADYASKWLTPIANDHGEFYSVSFARDYGQWNIATGSAGTSLNALASSKSQIFIGAGGGDAFTGGDLGDVMFAGAGADTLNGGGGNDELYGGAENDTLRGGAGYDIYHLEGNDTIEDSDGFGIIKDKTGQPIAGQIYKGLDGNYVFLSNPAITVAASGSDIKLTLASGDTVTLKDFGEGMLGLALNKEAPAPTNFSRVIVGDFAAIDMDESEPGMQPVVDDLGNVTSTVVQADRMDGLSDSAGNDDVYGWGGNDWISAYGGGDDRLDGGTGNDVITDASGSDILIGGDGLDILFSGVGSDRLYAGQEVSIEAALAAGNEPGTGLQGELLDGGEGDDVMVAGAGDDVFNGGRGNDLIVAGAGDDDIRGDSEANPLWAGSDWSVTRNITTGVNGSINYGGVGNDSQGNNKSRYQGGTRQRSGCKKHRAWRNRYEGYRPISRIEKSNPSGCVSNLTPWLSQASRIEALQ